MNALNRRDIRLVQAQALPFAAWREAGQLSATDVKGELGSAEDGMTNVIASAPVEDRYGDVVTPPWRTAEYQRNPVVPFGHNYQVPPVGRTEVVIVKDDHLLARIRWDATAENPMGRLVASQFESGVLNAVSVGFYPRKAVARSSLADDHRWRAERGMWLADNELLEISAVTIPANPAALAQRTFAPWWQAADDDAQRVERGVMPFADLPVTEEAAWGWDVAAQDAVLGDDDWARYRKAHLWFDPDNAEAKSGYKLPIALMIGSTLTVVAKGLAAAVGAINGARGGVDLPEADLRKAYAHAARYYEKLGKEPPAYAGKGVGPGPVGRMFGART